MGPFPLKTPKSEEDDQQGEQALCRARVNKIVDVFAMAALDDAKRNGNAAATLYVPFGEHGEHAKCSQQEGCQNKSHAGFAPRFVPEHPQKSFFCVMLPARAIRMIAETETAVRVEKPWGP